MSDQASDLEHLGEIDPFELHPMFGSRVHQICYHGQLLTEGREAYVAWECDHHHGEDAAAALTCASMEMARRRDASESSR